MRVLVLLSMVTVQWAAQALTVTDMTPAPGSTQSSRPASIVVTFSDTIVATASQVRVTRAGPDGVCGTTDDVTITPASVNIAAAQITIDLTGVILPNDIYRVTLASTSGPAGAVAKYEFEEPSGTTLSDSSGNTNNGTLLNGPLFNTTGGVDGGGALTFDGTNDYVEVPSSSSLQPSGGITVAVWAYITDPRTGNVSDLVRKSDPTNGYTLRWSDSTGKMQWHVNRGNQPVNPPTISITDNQSNTNYVNAWHHFAGTFDATTGMSRFYVDGVERVAAQGTPGNMDHSGALWLMWTPPGAHTPIPGKLDKTYIFNRALTLTEVQSLAALAGGIEDGSGNLLDGKYPGGGGGFPSGDGTFSDFVADFTIQAPLLKVTSMTPAPDSMNGTTPASIVVDFNHAPDAATLTLSNVHLHGAGPDGDVGTADDVNITPSSLSLVGTQLTIGIPAGPPHRRYQLTLKGSAGASHDVMLHYKFDENTGGTAFDSSGNLYTGNIAGTQGWTQGKFGAALNFNRVDTYVDAPSTATLNVNQTNFTVAAWVKIPAGSGWRHIFTKERDTNPNSQFTLGVDPSNNFYFTFTNNGNTDGTFPFTGTTVPANTWTHVAVTRSAQNFVMYVNGVAVASKSSAGIVDNNSGHNIRIGARYAISGSGPDTAGLFNGVIDDVQFYLRALTIAEINHIRMPQPIADAHQNALDGEYPGGGGGLPSGNGTAGGEFVASFRVNVAPIATPQSISTHGAKPIVLAGTDADDDMLTFSVVTPPTNGLLSGTEPNLTYTPTAGYIGSDSFTFRANDGFADSAPATISIEVTNQTPAATPQSITAYGGVGKPVLLAGTDPNSDPLSFNLVTPPQHGTLTGTPPNLTYTAALGYRGGDTFTFKVNDGFADSAAATVEITVANQPPAVTASASPLVLGVGETVAFSSQGSDGDGDPLSYSWDFGDGTGFAPSANPTHTYTAPGTYTVVLTVSDGLGGNAQATLTVRVGNRPAAAFTLDALAGFVGQKLGVDGSGSHDPGNALVSYVWSFGDGTDLATGVTASHVYDSAGMKTITLTVTDTEGLSDTMTRDILILPAGEFGKFDGYVKYAVKFDRNKSQADSLVFEANVNLGTTKVAKGSAVAVELAGRRYAGELDAKLRDKNGKESWQVLSGTKKQSAGAALIKLKVSKTSLGQQLVDAGVTPGAAGAAVKVNVPVRIELAGHVFEVAIATEFKFSKDGKKAAGKGEGP